MIMKKLEEVEHMFLTNGSEAKIHLINQGKRIGRQMNDYKKIRGIGAYILNKRF